MPAETTAPPTDPPPPPPPPAQPATPRPAPAAPPPPPQAPATVPVGFAGEVEAIINQERAARGLPALSANAPLTRAAEKYAALSYSQPDPMKLSHDLNGNAMRRVQAEGYTGAIGEVLAAMPAPSAQGMVQLWLNSPGHRDILLSPAYRDIGLGCAAGPHTFTDGSVWQIALCTGDLGG